MELDDFRWLLTDEGAAALASATAAVAAGGSELQVQSSLRRTTTPERAAAVLTQVELRGHAEDKLGDLIVLGTVQP